MMMLRKYRFIDVCEEKIMFGQLDKSKTQIYA